jgi:hypothetical protein
MKLVLRGDETAAGNWLMATGNWYLNFVVYDIATAQS